MKTALDPNTNQDQQQPESKLPEAPQEALNPEQQSARAEKHMRLRHDNLEGTQNTQTESGAQKRGVESLQEQQNQDFALSAKGKKKGRFRGESFDRLVSQVRTIVSEEQLEEILETAIESRAKGSGLELPQETLNNVAEDVYEQIDHALANGELSASDEVMAAIAAILREHIFDEKDLAYIISQINRIVKAESAKVQAAAEKFSKELDVSAGVSVQAEQFLGSNTEERKVFLLAFQKVHGKSYEDTLEDLLAEEYGTLRESIRELHLAGLEFDTSGKLTSESLQALAGYLAADTTAHLQGAPESMLSDQILRAELGLAFARINDAEFALALARGERVTETELSHLIEQSLQAYAKKEAALRSDLPSQKAALSILLEERDNYFRKNLNIDFSASQSSEIQNMYESAVSHELTQITGARAKSLAYLAGVEERLQSKNDRTALHAHQAYVQEHAAELGDTPEQIAEDPLYQQGLQEGARLDAVVEGIKQATDWWGTDEEKFFNMLKSLKSAKEVELVSKELKERTGYDIYEMIDKELSGVDKQIALDLVKCDVVSASASEFERERNKFWGPNPDKIKEILAVARSDKERFEAVYIDRYGEKLEKQANSIMEYNARRTGVDYSPVTIDSMEEVIDHALHGTTRDIAQAVYSGDEMLTFALTFKGNFGFFNDREKDAAKQIEALIAEDWVYAEKDGVFTATLSEAGQQKIAAFRQKFESVEDQTLDAFLESELSGGELDWMKSLLAGDRMGADSGLYRYACDGMGTDEELIFELSAQRRTQVLISAGLTEEHLQQNAEAQEHFSKLLSSYEAQISADMKQKSGRTLHEAVRAELNEDQDAYFSMLTSKEAIIESERIAIQLRMSMGGSLDGTDVSVIMENLAGKSSEEIEKIKSDYARLFKGRDLESDLRSELSGDDAFDVEQYLKGDPRFIKDPQQRLAHMKELLEARHAHEHSGILDGEVTIGGRDYNIWRAIVPVSYFSDALGDNDDGFGLDSLNPGMDEKYEEFIKEYEKLQSSDQKESAAAARRLETLFQQTMTQCDSYRFTKNMAADAIVDTVKTTAIVGVAIFTSGISGGAAAPLWVIVLSTSGTSAVISIGGRKLLKGDGYGREGMLKDAGMAAVEGGTAALGYGAVAAARKVAMSNAVSRQLISAVGAKIEGELGAIAVKEAVEEVGEKGIEYGAKGVLLGIKEGVETKIDDVAISYTLEASESAIHQALKSGSREVYKLIDDTLILKGVQDTAIRNTIVQGVKKEIQDQWMNVAALQAERCLLSRSALAAAEGTLDGFTSLGAEGMILTGIDFQNWQNGFVEGVENMVSNGIAYGAQGAVYGFGLGAGFSLLNKRAIKSKELTDQEVETLFRWQTPEGKKEFALGAKSLEKELQLPTDPVLKIKIPETPPIQLSEKGVALLKARHESHGVLTKGDVDDAILASAEIKLSARKAKKFIKSMDERLAQFEKVASQHTGDQATYYTRIAENYKKATTEIKERIAKGEKIDKLEYFTLRGVDKNPYTYRPREAAGSEQVVTEHVSVSKKSPVNRTGDAAVHTETSVKDASPAGHAEDGSLRATASDWLDTNHIADIEGVPGRPQSVESNIDELFRKYHAATSEADKKILRSKIVELEEMRLGAKPDPKLAETMKSLQQEYHTGRQRPADSDGTAAYESNTQAGEDFEAYARRLNEDTGSFARNADDADLDFDGGYDGSWGATGNGGPTPHSSPDSKSGTVAVQKKPETKVVQSTMSETIEAQPGMKNRLETRIESGETRIQRDVSRQTRPEDIVVKREDPLPGLEEIQRGMDEAAARHFHDSLDKMHGSFQKRLDEASHGKTSSADSGNSKVSQNDPTSAALEKKRKLAQTMSDMQSQYDAMQHRDAKLRKELEMEQAYQKAAERIDRTFADMLEERARASRVSENRSGGSDVESAQIQKRATENIDQAFKEMEERISRIESLVSKNGSSSHAPASKAPRSADDIEVLSRKLQSLDSTSSSPARTVGEQQGAADSLSPRLHADSVERSTSRYGSEEPQLQREPIRKKQAEVAVMDRENELLPGLEDMQRQLNEASARHLQDSMDQLQRSYDQRLAESAHEEASFADTVERRILQEESTITRTELDVETTPESQTVLLRKNTTELAQAQSPEYAHQWVPEHAFEMSHELHRKGDTSHKTDTEEQRKKAKRSRRKSGFDDGEGSVAKFLNHDEMNDSFSRNKPQLEDGERVQVAYVGHSGRWFKETLNTFFGKIITWRVKHN